MPPSPKPLAPWKPLPGTLVRYRRRPFALEGYDVLGMVLRRYSVKDPVTRVGRWCVDVAHPEGVDTEVTLVHVGPVDAEGSPT